MHSGSGTRSSTRRGQAARPGRRASLLYIHMYTYIYVYVYTCVYIYIYRHVVDSDFNVETQDACNNATHICINICIYIYIHHMCVYIYREREI